MIAGDDRSVEGWRGRRASRHGTAARVNSRGSADEAQHNTNQSEDEEEGSSFSRCCCHCCLLLLLLLPLSLSLLPPLLVMATSSSDGSCTAPADFQLSSELEDASSRLSMNLLKCPLCHNSRRIFYCRQCVQNGDFIHSNTVYSERCVFIVSFLFPRVRYGAARRFFFFFYLFFIS